MSTGLVALFLSGVIASPGARDEAASADPPSPPAQDEGELDWTGEDMGDFLAGFEDDDPQVDGGERKSTLDRPDVATGAVRLMGAYLDFPDLPELYPTGDDAIAAGVLRLIVDQEGSSGTNPARHPRRAIEDLIYEMPLNQWIDVRGSKLRPFDFLRSIWEMTVIYRSYMRGHRIRREAE